MDDPRRDPTRPHAEDSHHDGVVVLHPAVQQFLNALAAWRFGQALEEERDSTAGDLKRGPAKRHGGVLRTFDANARTVDLGHAKHR